MVNIDNILNSDGLAVQTRLTKYTLNRTECWGTKWFDDTDIITEPVDQTDDSDSYQDLITALAPDHWYKLDEAATGAVTDNGSFAQNGTSAAGTAVNQTTLLVNGTGKSAKFGNNNATHRVSVANFDIHAASIAGVDYQDGYIEKFTLEFLFAFDGPLNTNSTCPIMGQYDTTNKMFGPLTLNRVGTDYYIAFGYNMADSTSLVSAATYPWVYAKVTLGQTYHFAITYQNGVVTLYKDGVAMMSRQMRTVGFHNGGMPWANDTKTFYIGYAPDFVSTTVAPASTYVYFDEVVLYRTALSAYEVNRHAYKSKNYYAAEGGGVGPAPVEGNCDNRVLPTLTGGTDVTGYIFENSLQITRGDENLIDTLTFSCSEDWGYNTLASVFRANDYMVVEKRYSTLDGTIDTGWISIGHFLVEGPFGKEVTAQDGRKVYTVTAKSVTKILTFDQPTRIELKPDKLFVDRRDMEDVSSGIEYKSFRIPRVGYTNLFYGNISPFPTPKLWATGFSVVDDIVTSADVIRARGAEESVQFVYGTGTFRIDTDYFNTAVKDKGLGAPTTIQFEGYRDLMYEDILFDIEVTDVIKQTSGADIVYAAIRVAAAENQIIDGETYVGRTIFLQDGAAKGYMYRIVKFKNYSDTFRWTGLSGGDFTALTGNAVSAVATGESIVVTVGGAPAATTVEWDFLADYGAQDWSAYDSHEFTIDAGRTTIQTTGFSVIYTRSDNTTLTKTATVTESGTDGNYSYNVAVALSGGEKATLTNVKRVQFAFTITDGDVSLSYDYLTISPISLFDSTSDWEFALVDYVGGTIPDLADDGVAAGDLITVGDANTAAQALTKVFLAAGFQNTDNTKPLYFEFVEPAFDGGVTIPPKLYNESDSKLWISVVKDILEQCPPNYVLYLDREGVHRTKNVTQKTVANADHVVSKTIDFNVDGTDYGVVTRVIASGIALDATDVALSVEAGGTAAYGAYKLDNFADTYGYVNGVTKTQDDADAIINQIANGDPKTPIGWASDASQQNYGSIYRRIRSDCRVWEMEDEPLFWIDLGLNPATGGMYTIEEFEFQVFPVIYPVGTVIGQTFQLYYMTNEDYTAATGDVPPSTADDATVRANLNTMADSPFWRPLTSEFATNAGLTVLGASEFDQGRPTKMRFIKVCVGQPWHHPKEAGTIYSVNAISIIALAGLRIYTTTKIFQEATLGFTPPFDTEEKRDLAKRLWRRTMILEENPYLQDANAVKEFALQELKERYVDFEPLAVNAVAPTVDLWDTVAWTDPETGVTSSYLVKAISTGQSEATFMQLVDYSFFQEA